MTARLLGKEYIHQRQQRHEEQQQVRQLFIFVLFRSIIPRGAAFGLSRGVILHTQGLLSFLYDPLSSPFKGRARPLYHISPQIPTLAPQLLHPPLTVLLRRS